MIAHRAAAVLPWLPIAAASLVGCIFFYEVNIEPLLTASPGLIGGWDSAFYYFWLRSLVIDGDVNFMNDVLIYNSWPSELREQILSLDRTRTGLIANKYTVGWALLSLPWFLVGHGIAHTARLCGASVPADGYSTPYQAALAIGHLYYAVMSLALITALVQRVFVVRHSASVVCLVWLATFMLFYQTAELFMVHNATFTCIAAVYLLAVTLDEDSSLLHCAVLGVFAALTILCRPQAVVYLLYPGIALCSSAKGRSGVTAARLLAAGVGCGAFLLVQSVAWRALYGEWLVYSYEGETFRWVSPRVSEILFSSFHGLWAWHPIYFVGSVALAAWAATARTGLAIALTGSVLGNIYINASWHNWWFGVSFGSRAFECATLAVVLGIGFVVTRTRHVKWLQAVVFAGLAVTAAWNVNLSALAIKGALPLDRAVSFHEMIAITQSTWLQP